MKRTLAIALLIVATTQVIAQYPQYPAHNNAGHYDYTPHHLIQYDRIMSAWYVTDCTGRRISDFYAQIRPYSEGKAAVLDHIMGWSFIDLKGKRISGYYAETGDFHNGYALVKDKIMGWTYIDSKGNRLVNQYFEEAYPFQQEVALVKDKIMGWYLINTSGKRISNYHNTPHELLPTTPPNQRW